MKPVAIAGFLLLVSGLCISQSRASDVAVSAATAKRNSARGLFTPSCDRTAFHLTKVSGISHDDMLNLTLLSEHPLTWWIYRPQEEWTWLYAERCTPSGKCEEATRARIWLDKCALDAKRVSGKYEVDFGGQHLAGTFQVKYQKEKQLSICE